MRTPGFDPVELEPLLRQLRSGEMTPVEAVDETQRRVAALPAEANPFAFLDFDLARRQAAALPRKSTAELPLYGVPYALKDLEPTADLPTAFGAAFVDPTSPRSDGTHAARLRKAGAVFFAKTTTPTYGHKDVTDNLVNGITRNPWNLQKTPGGSSGGAAVLVAGGVSPVAHGTDAAGSVRMPAALCGVIGFKPSYGRLPRVPSMDLWQARGHHGFLANSVPDIRTFMNAVAGGDPRDPISPSEPDWSQAPARDSRGRVALVDSLFGQNVDRGVSALIRQAGDLISDAGIHTESPNVHWQNPIPRSNAWASSLDFALWGQLYDEDPSQFSSTHAALIKAGRHASAADVFGFQSLRTEIHLRATSLMDSYDFILTPTLPLVAWDCEDEHPAINGERVPFGPSGRWADVLLANLTGWPAISIPCGLVDGLPVGLQVMAPWRSDGPCLDFAEQLTKILQPLTS